MLRPGVLLTLQRQGRLRPSFRLTGHPAQTSIITMRHTTNYRSRTCTGKIRGPMGCERNPRKNTKQFFYFRVISWVSWPTIPYDEIQYLYRLNWPLFRPAAALITIFHAVVSWRLNVYQISNFRLMFNQFNSVEG